MIEKNNLLILERSAGNLKLNKENSGEYVLKGIFGEIDVKNKNNRIYTESEYVPQIKALQDKIKSSKLLGELDHPANFDISLKNVSHIIEELEYDKATKQVKGKIRLLDTEAGKQAKALVDAGVPLQISSRAAGAVESNGQVKIKQLFTYDLVADPGFANAELTRVNESFGFSNEGDIQIYELGGVSQELLIEDNIENKKTKTMVNEENSKLVSVEDFNKYSRYLSDEIKSLKESIATLNETIESNESGKEELDVEITESNDYSEQIQKLKEYTTYLAETLDNSISYSEHAAEGINDVKEYTNYLAESFNESTDTVANIDERLEKITAYTEYIAETVNKNLIVEDRTDDISDGEGDGLNGEEHPTEAGKAILKRHIMNNEIKSDIFEPLTQPYGVKNEELDLDIEIVSEEEAIEEGRAFAQAAKEAKDAGKDEFEFDGKTYPVTIKEDTADDIEDEEKDVAEVEELKDDEKLQAENECKCGGNCKCEVTEDEESEEDEDVEPEVVADVEVEATSEGIEETSDEDGNGTEAEDLEDETKDVTVPTEVNGKEVDETPTDKEGEQNAELEDEIDGAGKEISKEGDEDEDGDEVKATDLEDEDGIENVEEELELEIVTEKELVVSDYKDSVHLALKDIIEESNRKPSTDPSFFNFVSESTINDFKSLEEDEKAKVLRVVEGNGFLTENQIVSLWATALEQKEESELPVVAMMPEEYRETWNGLSEAKKSSLIAQSKYQKTETAYQVKNFWQTRDMREMPVIIEKVEMVNEATKAEEAKKSSLPYELDDMKAAINKRFKYKK